MALALSSRSPAIPPPSTYYYSTPAIPSLDPNIKIAMENNNLHRNSIHQQHLQQHIDHSSSALYQPLSNYESTTYRVDPTIDHHFISPPSLRMDDDFINISSHSQSHPQSQSQTQNKGAPFKPVISKNGYLIVYAYSPTEGESKVPISATVELRYPPEPSTAASWEGQVKLRLVLGRTALTTSVRPLEVAIADSSSSSGGLGNGGNGGGNAMVSRWQVSAITPPFEKARFPSHVGVPLTLQALAGRQEILDSITFGTFSYWEFGNEYAYSDVKPVNNNNNNNIVNNNNPNSLKRPYEEEPSRSNRIAHPSKRSPQQSNTDAHGGVSRSSPSSSHSNGHSNHNDRGKSSSSNGIYIPSPNGSLEGNQISLSSQGTTLVAAHGLRDSSDSKGQRAVLEWVVTQGTPHPDTFDKNWTSEERALGRRLVRFHRGHEKTRLLVACDTISQEVYSERDIVISCITRPDTNTNTFWFTSVDIIYLLERLVGASFTVEEKNRIRRNLEGFKPTTVSKSRPGFESFFQRIMDFPVPKPRNIEKDVKVFPWAVLSPALHKILSKYSLYVGSANPQVSPWLHTDTPSESPEGIRSSLPPQNLPGILSSQDDRPYSSHSTTRQSYPLVPSQQSSFDAQQQHDIDPEPQIPGLTFPDSITNSHDAISSNNGPWRKSSASASAVHMDHISNNGHGQNVTSHRGPAADHIIASNGGLSSSSSTGGNHSRDVFTSAYMRNASSPFITLSEVPSDLPGSSSVDSPFRAGSVTPAATWGAGAGANSTWLGGGGGGSSSGGGGANSRSSRHVSPDNHGNVVDDSKRKDVSYGGLHSSQQGNSLLLDLDPSSSSPDDIYPQYSLGNQTPIDDIIDHS